MSVFERLSPPRGTFFSSEWLIYKKAALTPIFDSVLLQNSYWRLQNSYWRLQNNELRKFLDEIPLKTIRTMFFSIMIYHSKSLLQNHLKNFQNACSAVWDSCFRSSGIESLLYGAVWRILQIFKKHMTFKGNYRIRSKIVF